MRNGTSAGSPELQQATCQHYWVIEPPGGPTSVGTCAKCGEQREFSNLLDAPDGWWSSSRDPIAPLTDADLAFVESDDHAGTEG